jgi:ABC-type sugar transport system ATPase subunit
MLTLKGVSKSFPGVRALSGVNLEVRRGEIHGLVGENGAGKSTLIKIVAGALAPDEGEIIFADQLVHWSSPREAKLAGVHVVYQEFALFPQLSVAENIFLGNERRNRLGFVDYQRTRKEASELMRKLGVALDPRATVASLSVADQQMVEIGRAITHNVRLLILDEPTAVIAGREVALLFERLRRLRESGVCVLFISHRLDEVFALCDRVTILKDGRLIGTHDTGDVTRERLISLMVGRDLGEMFPPRRAATKIGLPVLRTDAVSIGDRVRDISIEVRAGEIVALAGMVGAGRTDLVLGLFGAVAISSGTVLVDGKRCTAMSPAKAIRLGMGLVTEDRKSQGLAMLLDIAANITAPALGEVTRRGLIDRESEVTIATREIERYRIACRGPSTAVATMSGGNQQKLIIARWARLCRSVLILDEPTRGVDVGAKAEIYRIMRQLADAGLAILMISSELTEVIGMADRVIVMREGRITGELTGRDATEESIMHLATSEPAA